MQPQKIIVKTYKGSQSVATSAFQKDADKMAQTGYYPTSQNFAQGSYGAIGFLIALLLCFVFIGIVIFIYMLLVKPDGTLSVTYELQQPVIEQIVVAEKQCPRCAEIVKEEAKICRFCSHSFETV
jgi:Uncharacterised protein family UPF0547